MDFIIFGKRNFADISRMLSKRDYPRLSRREQTHRCSYKKKAKGGDRDKEEEAVWPQGQTLEPCGHSQGMLGAIRSWATPRTDSSSEALEKGRLWLIWGFLHPELSRNIFCLFVLSHLLQRFQETNSSNNTLISSRPPSLPYSLLMCFWLKMTTPLSGGGVHRLVLR